jgi:hypothetical protein
MLPREGVQVTRYEAKIGPITKKRGPRHHLSCKGLTRPSLILRRALSERGRPAGSFSVTLRH